MARWWWIGLGLAGCAEPGDLDLPLEPLVPANEHAFVLLELFTSQSCYSCPEADADLNRQVRAYRDTPVRVFPIAWHVTTWNGLGWVDVYSDERYSERQLDYVEVLDTHRYTPQLVAQGQEDFNGKADARVEAAKEQWIGTPGEHAVALEVGALSGGGVAVTVTVDPVPDGAEVQVVLLEGGLVDDIPSGENSGETLEGENVVRAWITLPADAAAGTLPVPAEVDLGQASVLAFVQDVETMAILGAAPGAL